MFSHVTAFISDLKLGFKSTVKTPYKSRRRRQRRHGKTNNYNNNNDDNDDSDDSGSGAQYGCLGRSVSMEWGLGGSSSSAAARRRRAKSTESLDRMSDHVRSAVSLMELTQGSTTGAAAAAAAQGRPPLQGTGAGGGGSTVTTDTWSSSNSSGGGGGGHVAYSANKRNKHTKSKTQDEANR